MRLLEVLHPLGQRRTPFGRASGPDEVVAAVDTARDAGTEEADTPLYGLSGSLGEDEEVTEALVDMLDDVFV